MALGPLGKKIEEKLNAAFEPSTLEVIDESDQHHGHAGTDAAGESHFRVRIVAEVFTDKSRVERHRLVHEALAGELKGRVHALALDISAPA
jgi:BolA protein